MSRLGFITSLLIALFLSGGKALATATVWQIDSNYSYIKFTIANLGFMTCHGALNQVYGRIDYKPNDLSTIKVRAEMDADTVQTGIVKRDNHLKKKEFFNLAAFPIWSFNSTSIEPISPAHFKMKGLLKIKGIEKEITLDCQGPSTMRQTQKGDKAAFTAIAETKVDRRAFGISGMAGMIGDVAKVTVRIRAVETTADEADQEFAHRAKARAKAAADHQKDVDAKAAAKRR
jgi:polyisoprenoid-binding protein YceI